MDLNGITINTTYTDKAGRYRGWNGYGSFDCHCGLAIDIGTGDHSMVEDFTCEYCGATHEIDWGALFYEMKKDDE